MLIFKYPLLFSVCICFMMNSVCSLKCGATQSLDPLAITMSPGFLSGALPYVGHHECTEAGTCKNIPFVCPTSSCCISNTNVSIPSSLVKSHCGCWDSKRKTCKPISSFRLGWETCSSESGVHVKTDLELASPDNVGDFCKNSGSSVEIGIDATTKLFFVRVTTNLCLQKTGRSGRSLAPSLEATLAATGLGTLKILKTDMHLSGERNYDAVPATILSRTSTKKLLEIVSNIGYKKNYQDKKLECKNYSEGGSAVISMCPSFLPGSVPNFLSQHSDVCSIHGECKVSSPACNETGCCLMSSGRNFSGCDCMANSGNCLLDHKVFKVDGLSCTTNGETVKADITVKVPSQDFNECIESDPATSSVKFNLNGVGNVEITVETKQCILSSVNRKYLLVESKVIAEVNIDQFLEVIQKVY